MRRARIWAKEIPRKVYQRKKALMSRPGMVFRRLRLLLVVVVAVMRGTSPMSKDGAWRCDGEDGPKDEETCTFDCIFYIFIWSPLERRSGLDRESFAEQTVPVCLESKFLQESSLFVVLIRRRFCG